MKSRLDSHWNKFNEVGYKEDLYSPSWVSRSNIVFPKGLEGTLFESNPHRIPRRCRFLDIGYEGLRPITNVETIKDRQEVIRNFADNFNQTSVIADALNVLNLIYAGGYSNSGNQVVHDTQERSKVLNRYVQETKRIVKELGRFDGILGEMSDHYRDRFPLKIVTKILEACDKGSFDYLAMEINPRNQKKWNRHLREGERGKIRFYGIMGLPEENTKGKIILEGNNAKDLGIDMKYVTTLAAGECLGLLNRIYSPLASLYAEAFYLKNNNATLPLINENGSFEMVGGRPIIETPNPRGTSISYDKNSAKVVLSGIHSGGKSHLLKTIAHYHLVGLSGFPLPATSATIPIVNRIFHSFEVDKINRGGSLQSEFFDRARFLRTLKEGDLALMDEFLQHASPDASTELEPIILNEFYDTGASVVVVTHRGDSLDDENKWQFYSPGFEEKGGRIMPTYSFEKGRPNQEILRKHAEQMLGDALKKKSPMAKESDSILEDFDPRASDRWNQYVREKLFENPEATYGLPK
jgi:hypothetical protein